MHSAMDDQVFEVADDARLRVALAYRLHHAP